MNQLYLLLTPKASRDTQMWATVTQVTPLRIRLDGESTALPFTPETLTNNLTLTVGDRVWITFKTNDDDHFLGSRIVVMGRSGGDVIVTPHTHTDFVTLASPYAVPSGKGVSAPSTTSGTDTTTSSSYVDMAGTGAITSFQFNKRYGAAISNIRVTGFQTMYQSGGSFPSGMFGVRVDGSDYDLHGQIFSAGGTNTMFAGSKDITGVTAGLYTIQARWKKPSGTGTLTRESGNWLSLNAIEVSV